jgi:cytochrome c peroxidase
LRFFAVRKNLARSALPLKVKKKPAKTVLKAFRKSSGIDKSLKALDKSFAAIDTSKITVKAVSKFEKSLKKFDAKKDAYIKHLKAALAKEKSADSAYAKGRKLPSNATEKQIKREVGAYKQALKGALKWAKSL